MFFGTCSVVAGYPALISPETKDTKLPEGSVGWCQKVWKVREEFHSVYTVLHGENMIFFPFQSDFSRSIPLVFFGTCSVLAGCLALTFPETKDTKLPETLDGARKFGRYENVCKI